MTKNAEVRLFIWFGATLVCAFVLAACGRDGYVVVKETKTPHRAFDLPTFGTNVAPKEEPPLPIIPIEQPEAVVIPPLIPNLLENRNQRLAKSGAGSGIVMVTFNDRTGDRVSKFPQGSVKDCAIFKARGESAGQKMFLYAHLATPGREMRMGLDVVLYEGKSPLVDMDRLLLPFSPASWTMRPVLHGRSLFEAKDTDVDAEGPPMWAMDTSLRRKQLDPNCRSNASIKRGEGAPKLEISLDCGRIAGDANTDAIESLWASVVCDARETTRVPFFAAEEKR